MQMIMSYLEGEAAAEQLRKTRIQLKLQTMCITMEVQMLIYLHLYQMIEIEGDRF
jgi:hypothetical protein